MSNVLAQKRMVDPILSGLAQGYVNGTMAGLALMPYAITNKEGGQIPMFGTEHFKVYATNRGLRAASNRINVPGRDKLTVTLEEHDLETAIDYREEAESVDDESANAVDLVQMGITLGLEYEIAMLARNAANYPDSNKETITDAGDKHSNPASDIEGQIEDGKKAVADGIMMDPNTMILPRDVLRKWKRHPQLRGILSNDRSRLVNLDDLREIFEIENIIIANAQYINEAGQRVPVWGNDIVMAYVPPGASTGEGQPVRRNAARPGYGYTLRRRGMPMVDTYMESGGKIKVVRSTDVYKPYLLGPLAGFLIKDVL